MKFNNLYYKPYKDQFNLYNLIKKINAGYRLYFNNKDKVFIIFNIDNNFEQIKIFSSFSENILRDLRFSKICNLNNILKYIDESNENLKLNNEKKINNISSFVSNEITTISSRSNSISQSDLNKIIGATKC